MQPKRPDEIGRLFTRITALVEDAAALAADVQSAQLSPHHRRRLATRIEKLARKAAEGAHHASDALSRCDIPGAR